MIYNLNRKETIGMEIGERIRQRREELGMTQDELARAAGYKSRSSINKIEVDGRGLPQNKIVDIAYALRVTPSYLMGWENLSDAVAIAEQEQLIENIMMLTKEHQEILKCFVDTLLEKQKG